MKKHQDKEWLEEQYITRKLSIKEIAALAGCSYPNIQYWLKKHGVPSRSPLEGRRIAAEQQYAGQPYTDKIWLEQRYWDDGLDMNEIGSLVGCSGTTILRWMERLGVPRRTKSRAGKKNWEENESRRERFTQGIKDAWQNGAFSSPEYRRVISEKAKERWAQGDYDGENHPRWLGGRSFEPYPPSFNGKFKKKIRERDGYLCAICRLSGKCVHHINYVKDDTEPMNCITLCRRCHSVTNSNRVYWETVLSDLMKARYGLLYRRSGLPRLLQPVR
jgi:predicted DNA-binding transcriptional regulator AlpA